MLLRTLLLIIIAPCTAHTLMATTLFVQFYLKVLESAAVTYASLMFALFHGDYVDLLKWPFPKAIHLPVCDQLDPHNKRTVNFAPSEKLRFRRPTRDLLATMTTFNFFPHSKMFSKTEKFRLNIAFYSEIKFADPKPATCKP